MRSPFKRLRRNKPAMAGLMNELVGGVVESVLKEILEEGWRFDRDETSETADAFANHRPLQEGGSNEGKATEKAGKPAPDGGVPQQDALGLRHGLLQSCKSSIFVVFR